MSVMLCIMIRLNAQFSVKGISLLNSEMSLSSLNSICHGSWVRVLIPCVCFVWVCHVWQPRILIRGYTCSLFHCLYLDRSFTILCQFVCFRSPVCFFPWLPVWFFVIRAPLLLGFVSSSAGFLFRGPLFYELGSHPWN